MEGNLFSISDFAELARTTRDTLLHYDRIGLFSPEFREKGNYRLYSSGQLALINTIRTMRESGLSLAEIREQIDKRTPESTKLLLACQIEKIDEQIEDLNRSRKLLAELRKTISLVLDTDECTLTVRYMPAEAIVLGELNDYSRGRSASDALLDFYRATDKKYPNLDLNYPVWGAFSQERIKCEDWTLPDRFFFHNPEGRDRKPASFYAVGYKRGGYGKSDDLYRRIISYIAESDFEIDEGAYAYEEYPLNEICIREKDNYLMRVMISVREKGN